MSTSGDRLKQGFGEHSMWGLSPSYNVLSRVHDNDSNRNEINILLVKPGDVRHVIHALAQRHRHRRGGNHGAEEPKNQQAINVFVLESEIEVLARHLIQLHVFLGDGPIRHRSALYLELYNSLISKRTQDFVATASKQLGDLVYGDGGNDGADDGYNKGCLNDIVDLSWLKQKERDGLHSAFDSWERPRADEEGEYDVGLLRECRLRGYYAERYDCRENICEWDYYSRVKEVASVIHVKQWREWRMKGIAFEFGDTTYTCANRTMVTSTKGTIKRGRDRGASKDVKGYWLDVLNGPFVSHGVEIEDSQEHAFARGLFKVVNKGTGAEQQRHHTVEVAMYNIINFMWELETGTRYEMQIEHDIFSGLGKVEPIDMKPMEIKDEENNEINENVAGEKNPPPEQVQEENKPSISCASSRNEIINQALNGISIIPICGDLKTLGKKKYKNRFDHIFLSQHSAHWMGIEEFKSILRSEEEGCESASSSVDVETGKFIFQLGKKDQMALLDKIKNLAEGNCFIQNYEGMEELDLNTLSFKLCQ